MQAAPAHEGMYLHGVLHRVEGDHDNARAWYGNVCGSGVFGFVWGGEGGRGEEGVKGGEGGEEEGKEKAMAFIDAVERLRKDKVGDADALGEKSAWEVKRIVEWCAGRFGEGRWEDASAAWVRPREDIRRKGEEMTSGGEGFRKF